ncbi:MAG: hypothetical protein ABF976_11720 [Acetobacter syzygii]|uniref:hypothetical protein n=1 Tax=Acetobacter syzygii TaxID=146476 RepID=UPI0039EC6E0B
MIIILSDQDQPVTIHPGSQNIVIIPAGQTSPITLPDLNALQIQKTTINKPTRATYVARRILPYAVIAFFSVWAGHVLSHKKNVQPIEKLVTPLHSFRTLPSPEAPQPDRKALQTTHPATQENPNTAFGLN